MKMQAKGYGVNFIKTHNRHVQSAQFNGHTES